MTKNVKINISININYRWTIESRINIYKWQWGIEKHAGINNMYIYTLCVSATTLYDRGTSSAQTSSVTSIKASRRQSGLHDDGTTASFLRLLSDFETASVWCACASTLLHYTTIYIIFLCALYTIHAIYIAYTSSMLEKYPFGQEWWGRARKVGQAEAQGRWCKRLLRSVD